MVCENSCPGTSVSSDVGRSSAAPVSSADVRPGVRPDVGLRPDVRAAPVSSEAKNKNAGGGSPPAKPVKGGGLGGLCPHSQKPRVLGGSAPQPKFFKKTEKNKRYLIFFPGTFLTVPYFST